jgi:DNA-binding beta-propeller fold protein YncE
MKIFHTFAAGAFLSICHFAASFTAQAQSIYEPYFFTHLAGLALNTGDTDNIGDLARFNQPWGVAVDGAGNVYVADTLNHTIRRITPDGAVTLLAGVSGSAGYNDGPAASAMFSRPIGVAVDAKGSTVYVTDYNNSLVRKISAGVVSTVAGSVGVFGSADGTGTAAEFNNPFGVALNREGSILYVTDTNNQTIRAISLPNGNVTTLAGAAGIPGATDDLTNNLNARFNSPRGIAVDAEGSIYVADTGNYTVRKMFPAGGVVTLAGSVAIAGFNDGLRSDALFSGLSARSPFGGPCGIAVDNSGNLYVTDQGNHTLRRVTPGGNVTTLSGLVLTPGSDDGTGSDARFRFPAGVAVDADGNLYVADTANHTIRVGEDPTDEDCPAAPPMDSNGNLILPPGLDPASITYVEINRVLGPVEDQYPDWDTSTDLWYSNLDCPQSVGGTVPDEASKPDLVGELAEIGIKGVTPEEIMGYMDQWNEQIAEQALTEKSVFPDAGPAAADYVAPHTPYCPDPTKQYAFGGRDIIFVHGLQIQHVFQKIAGSPSVEKGWDTPASFPGSTDNPAFYDGGYFKREAEKVMDKHIEKFLNANGYKNRYLIVSYDCSDRLEVGVQAILTQISDAMKFGTGVKHVGGPPNQPGDTLKFGTPSFVLVSHSTGTLITDVAMTAAAQNPNLKAGFIPQMAKAHVAMAGVFSGSDLATAAIALSGYASTLIPSNAEWVCALAGAGLEALDPNIQFPNCDIFSVFSSSILVDLVPLVSQLKWGSHVDRTPVRTITLVGGHPTMLRPLKYLLNRGFDDGVTTINSQVANPNSWFLWPSGFRPNGTGLIAPFDMGVAGSGNGSQSGLMSPTRAAGYYIDQVVEIPRIPPLLIAGGALPYLSPSGMRQDVADAYENTPFSTLNRYNNHFSYIQSAADHLTGYTGTLPLIGWHGQEYAPTLVPFIQPNLEESRVITDPAVYQSYEMFYPGDNAPLLNSACMPKVETWERGRQIPAISFRIFGRTYKWGPWWIWRRVYDLLEDWETMMSCDYMYESVLQCPPLASCLPCDEPFVVTAPEDKIVDCGSGWKFDLPTATGFGITITSLGIEDTGIRPTATTQTWLITDECGNASEVSQTVIVRDTTPPMLNCPKSVKVTNRMVPNVFALVSASDNCTPSGRLAYTQSPAAGTAIPSGGSQVTVTVTDQEGNSATCVIPITSSIPISVLQGNRAQKPLKDNKSTRNLGNVKIGKSSEAMVFTVKNNSETRISMKNIMLRGNQAKDFIIVKHPAKSIAPGKATKFKVIFKPSRPMASRTIMAIGSDYEGEIPFRIKLTGKGVK